MTGPGIGGQSIGSALGAASSLSPDQMAAVAQLQLMPVQAGTTSSQNGSDNYSKALLSMQNVLTDTQNQQAQGRLMVHLGPVDQLVQSANNVELEDGDQIAIPRRPSAVQVLGQVYTPNAIIWQRNLRMRDYLQMAGGPTEGADPDHIFVIRADGSVLTDQGLKDSEKSQMFPLLPVISGEGLMGSILNPGDTIYVPEQLVFKDKVAYWKDVTQIIANGAMSLGVMGLLGAQL